MAADKVRKRVAPHIVRELGRRLLDPTLHFPKRYRCLFSIMNLEPDDDTRRPLLEALKQKRNGALLRHEIAYVLGQMQDGKEEVIRTLMEVLKDSSDDCMVRHEAAEALGAIGTEACRTILLEHLVDETREVSETCQLALQRISTITNELSKNTADASKFNTVDPTLVPEDIAKYNWSELESLALDEKKHMSDRYGAIFEIRNRGGDKAIEILSKCLKTSASALLKHEVAFVLGQLQSSAATKILTEILSDKQEHAMVRHEAAEALGSVASCNQEILQLLELFTKDDVEAVAQSCVVAIDMLHAQEDGEFEYCDTLQDLSVPGVVC